MISSSAVATPYGLASVVEAAEELIERSVLGDVTKVISHLAETWPAAENPWTRFVSHPEFFDPADTVGELDAGFHFGEGRLRLTAPGNMGSADEALNSLRLVFHVRPFDVSADNRLMSTSRSLVSFTMRLNPEGWGELIRVQRKAVSAAWGEWAEAAEKLVAARWAKHLQDGMLRPLTSWQHRNGTLSRWLVEEWSAKALAGEAQKIVVAGGSRLTLAVVDYPSDAEKLCLREARQAAQVLLVSPELAAKLESRGAEAGTVHGLPLWSRASADAPHLDHVIQDIAYESFGQSRDSGLASTLTKE